MMQVRCPNRVGHLAGRIQTIWIFLKEERWLAVGIMTHFDRMGGIIAPDAIHTADWKYAPSLHGNHGVRGGRDHKIILVHSGYFLFRFSRDCHARGLGFAWQLEKNLRDFTNSSSNSFAVCFFSRQNFWICLIFNRPS